MLTNITLIVNEWQHSNFRKALTRNFTHSLTLNAISSMITSYKVTCWQKAVKHLQKRNNDPKIVQKKIFRSNVNFPKKLLSCNSCKFNPFKLFHFHVFTLLFLAK